MERKSIVDYDDPRLDTVPARFQRTCRLYGFEKHEKLRNAKVAIFGCGAVGSFCIESLVRSGIGSIRIIDFDAVDETNINRQIYALTSTVGKKKVEVAQARLLDINPDLHIETFAAFAEAKNIDSLIQGVDLVCDCIDVTVAKVALQAACIKAKLPIISSMGAATRTDPTKIQVKPIMRTEVCHLARACRTGLKQAGITTADANKYCTAIVSSEPPVIKKEYTPPENADYTHGRPKEPLASAATLTGMFGLWVANTAISKITEEL